VVWLLCPARSLIWLGFSRQGFTAQSPEGASQTCQTNNCPNTPGCSNIIIPNTRSAAGETLQIQSSNGGCVSGITIVLRVLPDCKYNTTFVAPL
jgi:hypothetical protein